MRTIKFICSPSQYSAGGNISFLKSKPVTKGAADHVVSAGKPFLPFIGHNSVGHVLVGAGLVLLGRLADVVYELIKVRSHTNSGL